MTPIFTTVLIIGIVISISLALIIIKHIRQENREEKIIANFHHVADEFNFFVSRKEVLGNRVIALDDRSNRLLFFSATSEKYDGYVILLDNIKSGTVKRAYGLSNSANKYPSNIESIVKKIALQLDYQSGAKPTVLAFYESSTDPASAMQERAAKAIEWQSLLKSRVSKTRMKAKSA